MTLKAKIIKKRSFIQPHSNERGVCSKTANSCPNAARIPALFVARRVRRHGVGVATDCGVFGLSNPDPRREPALLSFSLFLAALALSRSRRSSSTINAAFTRRQLPSVGRIDADDDDGLLLSLLLSLPLSLSPSHSVSLHRLLLKDISRMEEPSCVLVTGGCGFIGSNFINYTFDKWTNARFINYDKLAFGASTDHIEPRVRNSSRYEMVEASLEDMDRLDRTLHEYKVDMVIHFAAITHVDESYSDRVGTIRDNVISTTTLLESIANRNYKGIKRLVHISTDEIYGDSFGDTTPKTEQSLPNPTNPYAASKAACEMIIRSYYHSYKLPYVMVRMNNVYGPRQADSKLIPKFTKLALEQKPYPLMGDGLHTRSWMFVFDCAEAISRVALDGEVGEVYNIGTDFEMSNIELTRKIHAIVNKLQQRKDEEPRFRPIPDRPYHDRRYYIDFGKIKEAMGWQCTTPFDEGLMQTIEYYVSEYRKGVPASRIQG